VSKTGNKPKDLAARLRIDSAELASELCDQPRLFFEANVRRVALTRERMNLELELKAARADALLRLREEHPGSTVQVLDAYVSSDPVVRELEARLADVELREEESKVLVEAFRQRRECLSLLLDQNRAEIGLGGLRRRIESKYPGR